jgi:alpha-glucosidase
MKKLTLLLLLLNCIAAYPQNFEVRSPDGQIALAINNGDKLTYSVTFRGKEIVQTSMLGFEFRR